MTGTSLKIEGPLNRRTFGQALAPSGHPEPTLDLQDATFFDPFGLVGLACVSMGNRDQVSRQVVVPPTSAQALTYLRRMHYFDFMESRGVRFQHQVASVHETDRSDVLVELTWFKNADDLERLGNLLYDRLSDVVTADRANGLLESLWEIGDNTRQHARTDGGVAAAQVYGRGVTKRIEVAVGDVGCGIRTALAESGNYAPETDAKAIELALEPFVSGTSDPARGVGLFDTATTVRGLHGSLVVRTGDASRTLYPRRRPATIVGHLLEGTIVGMSIPCR